MTESHKPKRSASISKLDDMKHGFEELMSYVKEVQSLSFEKKIDFAEVEAKIKKLEAKIGNAAAAGCLASYEPAAAHIRVGGKTYRKLGQPVVKRYMGLDGEVEVERDLYREVGVRNGPTVAPLELRAGIVEGYLTPTAARATAKLAQSATSRESYQICRELKTLPLSRSSFQTYGVALGKAWERHREEGEIYLMEKMAVPQEAVSVSVSVDRVSVPISEPRSLTEEEKRSGKAPKNPIEVKYRMAFCGVLTLHDAQGRALESIRYGRIPTDDASRKMEESLVGDLSTILLERPDLKVVTLADGAPEMQYLLDRIVADVPKVCAQMVDFWHVIEKLSKAIAAAGWDVSSKLPQWRERLKNDDSAIDRILIELRTWALDYSERTVPEGLREALTYLENHGHRMRYASALRSGLPIGSGHVEATCKTLVTVRMKRAGSHWKPESGQAILGLRSLAMSTRWDDAMDYLLDTYKATVEVAA